MKRSNWSPKSKQNLTPMNKYWSSIKNQNHDNSFGKIESWIREVESQKRYAKKERKTNIMKNFIITNKYKFAVVILAAILVEWVVSNNCMALPLFF